MVGQGLGHLAVLFVPLPPVLALLLLRICTEPIEHPGRLGCLLGVLAGAQVYVAEEPLVDEALVLVLVLLVFTVCHPRSAVRRATPVLRELGIGLGAFALLAGYPLWFQAFGPLHLNGPAQAPAGLDLLHADLLGPLIPTSLQALAPSRLAAVGYRLAAQNLSESGIYIGLPVCVLALIIGLRLRQIREVRFAVLGGFLAFLIALGPRLTIDGHSYERVPLPFALLVHVPEFAGEVPSRYDLLVQMFLAVVVACGLERACAWVTTDRARSGWKIRAFTSRRFRLIVVAGIGIVAIVPLVPKFPYRQQTISLPSYLASKSIDSVASGSTVLTYPYPQPNYYNQAQLWQAVTGYRFKILGGYSIFPTASGPGTPFPPVLQPEVVQDLFDDGLVGLATPPGVPGPGATLPLDATTLRLIRLFMVTYGVDTVIVDPIGQQPRLVIRYLSSALGPPVRTGGLVIWYHVRSRSRNA